MNKQADGMGAGVRAVFLKLGVAKSHQWPMGRQKKSSILFEMERAL